MSKKRSNYKARKIYKEFLGKDIPKGMDIHHIDEDPTNDDLSNLLMLPKELHGRYHQWKRYFDAMMDSKNDGLLLSRNQMNFTVMAEFGKVCEECLYWIAYKTIWESHKSLVGDQRG